MSSSPRMMAATNQQHPVYSLGWKLWQTYAHPPLHLSISSSLHITIPLVSKSTSSTHAPCLLKIIVYFNVAKIFPLSCLFRELFSFSIFLGPVDLFAYFAIKSYLFF